MIGLDNSWGTSYGVNGSFRMGFAALEQLLAENGDCTAPQPLKVPAPVPGPAPEPQPGHPGLLAELAALVRRDAAAAVAWLEEHHL